MMLVLSMAAAFGSGESGQRVDAACSRRGDRVAPAPRAWKLPRLSARLLRGLVLLCLLPFALPLAAETASYPFKVDYDKEETAFRVIARNDGPAPVTVVSRLQGSNIQPDRVWPVTEVIAAHSARVLGRVFVADPHQAAKLSFASSFNYGDYRVDGDGTPLHLPFRSGAAYRVSQAPGGVISTHTEPGSINAIDFSMPEGTPVVTARAGIVVDVTNRYGSGGPDRVYLERANVVHVLHDDGTLAVYAHLLKHDPPVTVGQRVAAGDLLGYSGSSGYVSGPHLHFALYRARLIGDGTVGRLSLPIRFLLNGHPQALRQNDLVRAE
jgi:murein DD-endopeptidase MepM/ murein hydrolase activator NlpD